MRRVWLAMGLLLASLAGARGAEIRVLSAGAVEPGLAAAAEAFGRESGAEVAIAYATPGAIRKRLGEGEKPDIVVVPPWVLDEIAPAGPRVEVGRVGVGVVVREGAPVPHIAGTEALVASLRAAERIVFNRASTGTYVEKLLGRLGLAEELQPRIVRVADGAAVMERLIHGEGREIGLGAMTEILLFRDKGARLVGPLPEELQNYTSYAAVALPGGANPTGGRAFVAFLATPAARALLAANGVE
jgi:molybdate transport system substrate-binding protein